MRNWLVPALLVWALAPLSGCRAPGVRSAPSLPTLLVHDLGFELFTPEGYPAGWYVEAEAGVGGTRGEMTMRPESFDVREGATPLHVTA